MALDPNLKNNIDPNVWAVLVAQEARIAALEAGGAPTERELPVALLERYSDKPDVVWTRSEPPP